MSRSDAFVTVACDHGRCTEDIELRLTPLAGRGEWDGRAIDEQLRKAGWPKDGPLDICPYHTDNPEKDA